MTTNAARVRNGFGSYWLDSTKHLRGQRDRLHGDLSAQVAIVGGGYSGLWTAYWLKRRNPGLEVVVIEQAQVGFGASGRNGGWISGKTVGVRRQLLSASVDRDQIIAVERECRQAVGEIADLMAADGREIDAWRGGWMQIARSASWPGSNNTCRLTGSGA